MEGECSHFCAGIVHVLDTCDKASHAGQSHNMAMVAFGHCGHKFLDEQKMGDEIDVESSANLVFAFAKDSGQLRNSRVIDQDCRVAMLCSDLLCNLFEACGGCNLGLVKVRICSYKRAVRVMYLGREWGGSLLT